MIDVFARLAARLDDAHQPLVTRRRIPFEGLRATPPESVSAVPQAATTPPAGPGDEPVTAEPVTPEPVGAERAPSSSPTTTTPEPTGSGEVGTVRSADPSPRLPTSRPVVQPAGRPGDEDPRREPASGAVLRDPVASTAPPVQAVPRPPAREHGTPARAVPAAPRPNPVAPGAHPRSGRPDQPAPATPPPRGSRPLTAEEFLRDHLAPVLAELRALTPRERDGAVAIAPGPRIPRGDGRAAVALPDLDLPPLETMRGDVHIHVDRVDVLRPEAPAAPPAPQPRQRPDHAEYLARQERRWDR